VRDCRKADKPYDHVQLENGHHIMPFADFNARLQDDMKIVAEIANLVFGAKVDDMFVTNEYTQKQTLNPSLLSKLKQFQLLKTVTMNCSDEEEVLDLTLLKQFTEQVLLMARLKQMIVKYSNEPAKDNKFHQIVHSFLVLRPKEILMEMSTQTETLEGISRRVNNLGKISDSQQTCAETLRDTTAQLRKKLKEIERDQG
jgi:hypothetical protein